MGPAKRRRSMPLRQQAATHPVERLGTADKRARFPFCGRPRCAPFQGGRTSPVKSSNVAMLATVPPMATALHMFQARGAASEWAASDSDKSPSVPALLFGAATDIKDRGPTWPRSARDLRKQLECSRRGWQRGRWSECGARFIQTHTHTHRILTKRCRRSGTDGDEPAFRGGATQQHRRPRGGGPQAPHRPLTRRWPPTTT